MNRGVNFAKIKSDTIKTHPKYLALVVLRYLHVLDTDDLLVSKHSLVLWWELLPRFPGLLLVPILLLTLATIDQPRVKDIESDHLTCLYLRRPATEWISKTNEVSGIEDVR